ncbi:MAG: hypothetical protein KTR29_16460 [Rhodothermaceae bacterium]|nr:hypothetical protein [Rhodothermaceae bacterium]
MSFDHKAFSFQLLSEVLFYDEEYGATGNLSLIDSELGKELYVAFYSPQDQQYVIEKATEWELMDPDDESEIGYEFASDSETHLASEDVSDIVEALQNLAEEKGLYPSMSLSFEDDEVV